MDWCRLAAEKRLKTGDLNVLTALSAEPEKGTLLVLTEDQTRSVVCDLGVMVLFENGGAADAVSLILDEVI